MKETKNLDTSMNLEQKITAALSTRDATSDALAALIAELENAISDGTIKVERERAFDLTTSPDAAAAHRAITEAEFVRARLRLVLPELQHKLEAVCEQERAAQWELEFLRIEALQDAAAKKWARVPEIIDELVQLFREDEAIKAECSRVNGSAPPGEDRRLVGPELHARGLKAFSRASPPMAKNTTLPDWSQSEKMLWPPKSSFVPFAPAPQDIRHSADWHRASTEQRHRNDQRIDRELAEMEAARKEFYRGR